MAMGDYNPFAPPISEEPKDDKVAEPTEVDKERQRAEAAEAARKAAEAKLAETQAAYERKLEEISASLSKRYADKVSIQEPKADAPKPSVGDSDFDKSPSTASRMVAREEVRDALQTVGQHFGVVIGNLQEQAFDSQLAALRNDPKARFIKYVEPQIRDFFEKNPEAKGTRNAVKTIYQQFVGQNLDDLMEMERKDKELNDPLGAGDDTPEEAVRQARIVRPDVRDELPPRVPSARSMAKGPKTRQLTANEREVFEVYKRYGVFDDEEDWVNWSNALGSVPREGIPGNYEERGR